MKNNKIAWITDSTAYVTEDLKNHPDVYVIPLSINFGDETFSDGVNLCTNELYKRIREEKEIPKTSQPSAGEFSQLYEKLKGKYDGAIAIHVSSELSGTFASSVAGAKLAGFPVEVVDSKSMSYAITTLIYNGMDKIKSGFTTKQVAKQLREDAKKSENFILLGSLEQFYKGGRMSGAQYLLGNLLRIKPIIRINNEGTFELFEKVRSERRAIRRLIQLLQQSYEKYRMKHAQIMHGNVAEKAEALKEELLKTFPSLQIVIGEISSTIAVHAGEGTLAVIWNREN